MKTLSFKIILLSVIWAFNPCFISHLSAQVIIWTAQGDGQSWSDKANWNPNMTPEPTNHVIINDGSVVMCDVEEITIRSMVVGNKSHLFIPEEHTFTVDQSTGMGIRLEGNSILENRGILKVKETTNYGISNYAKLYNYGEISFYDLGGWGLFNGAEVVNNNGASIEFYNVSGSNIYTIAGSHFSNAGLLYLAPKGSGTGIRVNAGIMENTRTGEIFMGKDAVYNFFLNINGEATNDGSIQLYSNVGTGKAALDLRDAYFENKKYGSIEMQEFVETGLRIREDAYFKNYGDIMINGNNQTYGIKMQDGSDMSNKRTGTIQVSDVQEGLRMEYSSPNTSAFYNAGIFECERSTRAIYLNGKITNQVSGEMYLSRNYKGIQVQSNSEYVNSGGTILFANTSGWDIQNFGLFLNNRCSEMTNSGRIISHTTFGNFGFINVPTDGLGFYGGYPIENYGVVFDPFDRANLNQQAIRIPTISNYSGAGLYTDVLDIYTWFDSETEPDWYLDAALNNVAGTYNKNNNTFQANAAASGATGVYAKFYDEDFPHCYQIHRIPFDSPVSTNFTGGNSSATFREASSSDTFKAVELKIYPNPSSGLFYLETPGELKQNCEIQIVNAQGQIISRQQSESGIATAIDLSAFPKGIYLARVLENNKTLGQEKIVLLK